MKSKSIREKIGKLPGTLIYTGDKPVDKVLFKLVNYHSEGYTINEYNNLDEALKGFDKKRQTWLKVKGLSDVELIRKIGEHFSIHALILEDIIHVQQLPKVEIFDDYLFFTLNLIHLKEDESVFDSWHMSFILGENFLISFQERQDDYYQAILDRIASHTTKVKQRKTDYLLYYLVDLIIDQYYYLFESLNKQVESVEVEVMEDVTSMTVNKIISLKKQYSEIQKQLDPVEAALREINKSETPLVEDYVTHYFNDVIDHIRQYRETIRQKQESLSSLIDLNMSVASTKMNRVMYILTIVMTIFVPLTFIAGIYGMNFEYMPELGYKYSYFIILAAMLVIGTGILVYMKRKKWF